MTRLDTSASSYPVNAEKEREKSDDLGALKALWPFIVPYRYLLLVAITALVLTAVVSLSLPIAVRRVVDNFGSNDDQLLNLYFISAVGIAALLAIGTGFRYALVSRLGERVIADIRKAVFDRVIGMPPAFFEKTMTGEVLSRITTDTTLILSVIGSSVSIALRNILILIGGLILMFLTSPTLTGLALLLVPLVVVPILIMGRRLRYLSRKNQDWIAASSGNASEALGAVQTVQAFCREAESRAAFADVTELSYEAARQRIWTRSLMTVIVIFLVFTGVVGILWVGANNVRQGQMTTGLLVQFLIFSIMVSGSVAALSEIWGELQRAAGATERLVELLQSVEAVSDPIEPIVLPQPSQGHIKFESVSFHYPSRPDENALESISFSVEPGETIAFVGPSGAGKSTIFQLILRFYDPDVGRILIDGIDLAEMTRNEFRKCFALVAQEPVIFSASARDNIRFGRTKASDKEVENAARSAAAHEFISALPDGYETYVGERGIMLSGGQRQRIAIARAILREAPVLLLDEATSALDSESEQAVKDAIKHLSSDCTTLIVAHRLSTVKQADRIIVIDQGRIVAQGKHEALINAGGLYARLARLQFTENFAAE
ncbi:MAG: ABC transporter transmembrane domain-containing protein [Aestuariivita sp.]|nr:ABC transporter transmembrane domain-containing protein [Aestuariivita sp.]